MQSKQHLDVVRPHGLRIRLLCFLVRCNVELVTGLISLIVLWVCVCPSCKNMTSMFIDVFARDQETMIIR
jgi:hypothetical protein